MRRGILIPALALLVAMPAIAQERPHFSGKWKMVGDMNSARGLSGLLTGLCGSECEISEAGTTLTVRRTPQSRTPMPEVFTIDWTQSRSFTHPGQGAAPPTTIAWTSEWKGATLVITSVETNHLTDGDVKVEARHTLSLENGSLKIHTEFNNPRIGTLTPTVTYQKVAG